MAPEFAAAFTVGSLVTFSVVNLNLYLVHREFKSPKVHLVNHNLSRANLFWSNDSKRIIKIPEGTDRQQMRKSDYQKSTKSAFIFGTIMIFLSWFGLALFLLYFISLHKIAKSREEIKLFNSQLATQDIQSSEQVLQILKDEFIEVS